MKIQLIRISKLERDQLEKAGLLKFKQGTQDPNLYVTKGHHKSWYVVEEYKIMVFLGLRQEKKKNTGTEWKNKKNSYQNNY